LSLSELRALKAGLMNLKNVSGARQDLSKAIQLVRAAEKPIIADRASKDKALRRQGRIN
ncbi:unnamed protein product, partial [marine sediment metagenome]